MESPEAKASPVPSKSIPKPPPKSKSSLLTNSAAKTAQPLNKQIPPKGAPPVGPPTPKEAAKGAPPTPPKGAPPVPPKGPPPPSKGDSFSSEKETAGGSNAAINPHQSIPAHGETGSQKFSSSAIRVLYLRSLDSSGDSSKIAALEAAFGRSAVSAPRLGTRRIGIMQLIMKQATIQAEIAFRKHKPNVIVAVSYGAVVALQMDVPKVALVLLSPATDVYFRLLQMRPTLTLREHPYSILINASKDSVIPLDDSIRLVETADIGSCRLEVVDDDHTFNSLTSEDFKGWVEEAYQKGAEAAEKDAAEGGKKHFDVSLFLANSAAAEDSNQQQQTTEV